MMSKVVIIGAGLGGLSCGYLLQKNGYDVTILEQGWQAGGCLQCFSRDGVRFETGMHFIGSAAPGQTMDRMMHLFGLSDAVSLSPLETSAYNTVSLAGGDFRFPNGKEAFIESMAGLFPKEKDALRKYVDIINGIAAASEPESILSDSQGISLDPEYMTAPVNAVLDSLFRDEVLKNVLVGDGPLYSVKYGRTPFSLHAFIMDFYNKSAFRVIGGSDSIAKALSESIENMGGVILKRTKAVKIHCNEAKATGVETEDGRFFDADYVISAIHPNRLMEMLDTKLIRKAFHDRICSLPQTSSVFALYLKFKEGRMPYMNTNHFAYSGSSSWNCENYFEEEWPKSYLYMHFCHKDKAEWAESGVVMAYMNYSDVMEWQGTAVGRRGVDYEDFKRRHAARLMAEVEKGHPGFTSAVESWYSSTPLTYSDYTGTQDGSIYGVAKDVTLGMGGRVPYRTKVPNLFLAGQNVNSHGILGVLVGTLVTCRELLPAGFASGQLSGADR